MRVLKVILLVWMGWPLFASACSCGTLAPKYFFNTTARSPASPYVAVPENAKGILFFSDLDSDAVERGDAGKLLVKNVPPAVTAAQFSIVKAGHGEVRPASMCKGMG